MPQDTFIATSINNKLTYFIDSCILAQGAQALNQKGPMAIFGERILRKVLSGLHDRAVGLSERLELVHGPSAARVLSFASQAFQPEYLGAGLQVRLLDDRRVWTVLPFDLRNRVADGPLSMGRLAQLAEFTIRCFIERHVDLRLQNAELTRLEVELDQPIYGETWARFEWPEADLENWLGEIRRQRLTKREPVVTLLSDKEQRLGQVRMELRIASQLALNGLKE